jgi:hypothetical protein
MTNDLWKGYTRDPEMTEKIIATIRDALYTYPEMRLGQIIDNAIGSTVGYSPDLFNVYDETLVLKVQEFTDSTSRET